MKGFVAALLVGSALLSSALAAGAERHRDAACKGCELDVPEGGARGVPLLVALHGDEGSPAHMIALWKDLATSRGMALFAVKCPAEAGCTTGSFWRWNGPPSWLLGRVAEIEATFGTNPERRYLTTWSGGTSYAGLAFRELGDAFTAINLSGGGLPPVEPTCGACPAPVLFLSGEKNPLRSLAEDTRGYLDACRVPVEWVSLPGADHGAEARAYRDRRSAILDFFEAHPTRCAVQPAPIASAPVPSVVPDAEPPVAPAVTSLPPATSLAPPPPSRCSCETPGASARGSLAASLAFAATLVFWARRRK